MEQMKNDALRERLAAVFEERYRWPIPAKQVEHETALGDADAALAALGLDDLDAAVHRANIDHPHTGLQIGTDCARAVLEAALLNQSQSGDSR